MRLTDRIAARLSEDAVLPKADGPSDYDLNPEDWRPNGIALRSAAVLVPLIDRPDGVTVLLTKRTEHLNSIRELEPDSAHRSVYDVVVCDQVLIIHDPPGAISSSGEISGSGDDHCC